MIRTERYKYTCYLEGGEELFDLASDPGERRNLAADPARAGALREHRALLAEHVARTRDPFFSLEVRVDGRWRSHTLGYPNHRGPSAPLAAQGKPL
jgi:choline-sulfatase